MISAVHLRPVIESDFAAFDAASASEENAGTYQWFGFTTSHRARRKFDDNGLVSDDGGTFAIVVDGEVVGSVDWFTAKWGREASWCWSIGIGVHRGHRGRGIGTRAQQLIVDYLFRHTRAHRIQAFTDRENAAERRALQKAGFAEEGIVRSAQWRNGSWHDQVLYSVLRESWKGV